MFFSLSKWKLCLVALLVLAFGVSLAVSRGVTRFKRERNKRRTLAACETKQETIFVMLVAYKDAGSAAQTLFSLFSKADCPLRVYIGLYEFFDEENPISVMTVFESMVKMSAAVAFSMQDHVRILRAPASEFKNAAIAREQLQRFLYRSETFTLCLGRLGCVMMSETWDTHLVAVHATVKDKNGAGTVITTVLETGKHEPSILNNGTFVGMGDFCGAFPKLLAYRMKRGVLSNIPVPALAWSASLSFTKGTLPYPSSKDIDFSVDAEDIIMTFRILERGATIWHPTKEIACNIATALPPQGGGVLLAVTHAETPTPLSRVPFADRLFATLGVDVFRRAVTARGRLGLLPPPNKQNEIDAKIGTAGDFLSLLSRLEVKALQQQQVVMLGKQPTLGT